MDDECKDRQTYHLPFVQTYVCNLVVEFGSGHLYRQRDPGTYRHRNHHEVHESNRQDQTNCSQQDPEFIFDEREFRKSFHVNWVFPRNSLSGIRLSRRNKTGTYQEDNKSKIAFFRIFGLILSHAIPLRVLELGNIFIPLWCSFGNRHI